MRKISYLALLFIFLPILLFGKEITLERLYSEPSLIGILPTSPEWSYDEKICAFLWNENGRKVNNLYYFSPQSELMPEKITSFEEGGISEIYWGRKSDEIVLLKGASIYILNIKNRNLEEIIKTEPRKRLLNLSPSRQYMSFLQDGNLWIYDFENETMYPLTHFDSTNEGLIDYLWSPDSRRIALYYQDLRGMRKVKIPIFGKDELSFQEIHMRFAGDPIYKRKVGVFDIHEGKIIWIGINFDNLLSLKWSPSGKKLLLEKHSEYATIKNIYVVQVADMEVRSVYKEEIKLQHRSALVRNSEWIGENQIAYLSNKDGYSHLYSLDLSDGEIKKMTSGEWEVIQIYPVKGKEFYFIANKSRPENRLLFKVDLQSGEMKMVGDKEGVYRPFISRSGKNICVLFSDDMTPFDLYYVHNDKLRRITSSPLPEFYEYDWAKAEYRYIESKRDGSKIRVKILFPPDFSPEKEYPAIIGPVYWNTVVNQWGGRVEFDQYLVQVEKYILMNIDIRGSLGYGRRFQDDVLKGYGVVDIEDIKSGALYLKSLPYIKKDRIGIWGSSYGGLLTLMCLFKMPDVFACGIAGASVSNMFHHGEVGENILKSVDDKDVYMRSSPYFWSQNLKVPLMIIHGIKDNLVQFGDSVRLVNKLIKEGKDFEFVVLPDASHGWSAGPAYQTIFAYKKMISFFSKHLKD